MTEEEQELIRSAVVRLRARILAVVTGFFGGVAVFLATASLLVKGGPNVGQHLRLLSHYCPGYDVTWPGALLGFAYGVVYGGIAGYAVAWLYNRVADRRRAA